MKNKKKQEENRLGTSNRKRQEKDRQRNHKVRKTGSKQFIWDTIIIGAGAAGMAAAIACGKDGQKVLLIERQSQMGRKILVTGNGKCNLTNFDQKIEYYRSDSPKKVRKVLSTFGQTETMDLFQSLGIYTKDKNGYVYPYSEQAASVRESFETAILSNENITFLSGCEWKETWEKDGIFHVLVTSVTEEDQSFKKEKKFCCKSLLITTGGLAGPKFGCDGSGYKIAEMFGHTLIRPLPALTALKSSAPFLKKVSGVRNQASITLKIDGEIAKKETGELQWTDYGISGVAIFQLSRFAITALEENKKVSLYFDFMPELSLEEKYRIFLAFARQNKKKEVLSLVKGLFPAKLCPIILREAKIDLDMPVGNLKEKDWDRLVTVISYFPLRINGYFGYEKAQVTRGGISLSELTDSLESTKCAGLFFAGEVTDVDGTCGGYNLQWAFSSGTVAGRAIVKRNQDFLEDKERTLERNQVQ